MAELTLNPDQRAVARHALGLPNKRRASYRNHFVTGAGCTDHVLWADMVAKGAAWQRPGSPITGGDDLFGLTEAGARAALDAGERLDAEDFPQKDATNA